MVFIWISSMLSNILKNSRMWFKMNKKTIYFIIALFSVSILTGWAQEQGDSSETDFLCGFLQGSYHLIGRLPDSDETYSGEVVLKEKGDKLEVIRRVEGREIKGIGKIETATADKKKVLRIRFMDGDKSYEATYLIGSDLDNYGRLTGYLYLEDGSTKVPGLEALFIDHRANGK